MFYNKKISLEDIVPLVPIPEEKLEQLKEYAQEVSGKVGYHNVLCHHGHDDDPEKSIGSQAGDRDST